MKIIYRSRCYKPENVTGRYVRAGFSGIAQRQTFRVFECEASSGKNRLTAHCYGATIREYDTDGQELPEELKAECIETKQMCKWADDTP